ncbi:hypothetical protein QZH41_010992 [Actinostola sp. cb2023]|nr:hypothetical protein QZH41_010992 [Actinostola sp. cb2023]
MFRAKELDGGYFENLTSLDWRKTIKRAGKQHIKQIEDLPEPNNLEDIPEGSGDDKEVVSDGKTTSLSEAQVLKISEERHRELYNKMKQQQQLYLSNHTLSFSLVLLFSVLEARKLEAKDANGFSDPYCMVGLIKSQLAQEESKPKSKRKISKTLQEILKSESIQMTTVRENTVNPMWNETFLFEVNDITTDILQIDIWDCDDKQLLTDSDNKITKIKGFHGVGRYLKDAVQSARASSNESTDDFLGYLDLPLKNLVSDGIDKWFPLKTKSSKCRVSGDCHVKISLSSGQTLIH